MVENGFFSVRSFLRSYGLESRNFVGRTMRSAVAGASAARHAAALSRPVRGGVGQLDAVAASQPAAMADGCVAQHVGQVAGKGRMLLVHNSMLKPSRSIKMLTFMLFAAVGRSYCTSLPSRPQVRERGGCSHQPGESGKAGKLLWLDLLAGSHCGYARGHLAWSVSP